MLLEREKDRDNKNFLWNHYDLTDTKQIDTMV